MALAGSSKIMASMCVCTVLAVKPFSGCYPACFECLRKLRALDTATPERKRFWCRRCWLEYSPVEVGYRYCVALTVTDHCSCANVVLFGQPLQFLFGLPATQLHRYLEEKSSVAPLNVDTSELLKESLETLFIGKCFTFSFGSRPRRAPSVSLSDICQRQNTTKGKRCQVSDSMIATGIKPLGAMGKYPATVFMILESYFNEATPPAPPANCHSDSCTSSLMYASSLELSTPSQVPPAVIQLESYYCEPNPMCSAFSCHSFRLMTKDKHCSKYSYSNLDDSPTVRSSFPVCSNSPINASVHAHVSAECPRSNYSISSCGNCDLSITAENASFPSVVRCDRELESGSLNSGKEEPFSIDSDLEASIILQELASDWERSQLVQGTAVCPSSLQLLDILTPGATGVSHSNTDLADGVPELMLNPNLSVYGQSETFWTEFNGSFDHSPAPASAHNRADITSGLRPKPPTCVSNDPCTTPRGTPELFPSTQSNGSFTRLRRTNKITSTSVARTTTSTCLSPDLFESSCSSSRIPPSNFSVPSNCAQASKSATPRSCLQAAAPIRRKLLRDITNTPCCSSPLEITSASLDGTPTQPLLRTQFRHNGPTFSPELFSPL